MPLTPKGYTTKQEVEDYLFADLDPAYDAALDDLIAKAEDYVEQVCRRRFDSYATDQMLNGNGDSVIGIPDTQVLNSVTLDQFLGINETTVYSVADTDWTLEPASAPNTNKPFTRLRLLAPILPLTLIYFPSPGRVTLKGIFGWASVPATIRLATTMLVAAVTRRWRNTEHGDVSSLTEGNYSVTFAQVAENNDWQKLVLPYKRLVLVR